MRDRGFLIVWSDVDHTRDTDYLHWFTREHAQERVSTPGFLQVRLFRTQLPTTNRYLIVYELERPEVLVSPDYLAKLNNPSKWTQATFKTLTHFMRAGGRIAHQSGIGQGGTVTALTFPDTVPADGAALVAGLAQGDRIAAARLYETDRDRTAVKTKEKEVRQVTDDRSFAGMLLIEGLDEAAVNQAIKRVEETAPGIVQGSTVAVLTYTQVFTLEKRMI